MTAAHPLGESSPLTIGLAIVLLALAFSGGLVVQRLNNTEDNLHELKQIQIQNSEIIRQNARRIDLLERTIPGVPYPTSP